MAKLTSNKIEKTTSETVLRLFELLDIESEIVVTYKKPDGKSEEYGVVEIEITAPEEKGLIIGKRGATLMAIQSFVGMALKQKLGEWIRVVVNVGDWRERQEDYLQNLAMHTAERARETGEAQNLYNLSSAQRRMIHMYLAEAGDIETESQGEGSERYLVVKLRE